MQLTLHKVEEAREELRKSLKIKKDMAIVDNDIYYKEIDTTKVFANGDSKEFDVAIAELMEKNRIQAEEIRSLKIEHESQVMMLCEIIEQKKRAREILQTYLRRSLLNSLGSQTWRWTHLAK